MSPEKEADIRRSIVIAFGKDLKSLKRAQKVLKKMVSEMEEHWDELDAEYEMGRGPMPPGYMKRRQN